ncbi:S-adenosyl-L-methionine-dependent methyltransferase [Cristinia sonorae]|uniref:S-adenosyl-L-methionine-dependent methyltransferase n=1 Tax=Cristinia sonorae TaxID=1940300 RepID=A0A8K0UD23_9AGAR|nr:S-adenosyl-L-methionine-dependent methyltransferase [Cristinia sonorae]
MAQPAPKDTWSAQDYDAKASFVYSEAYTTPVLRLLNPQPGDKIYDFGCGSGDLTIKIAKAVGEAGVVVGVDSSESMITQARKNGLLHGFVSDIQAIRFPEDFPPDLRTGFDAVFSNAALHWCKTNPKGVIESAKTILKPGGRFVAEMGGFMNCVGVRSAIHTVLTRRGYDGRQRDPWYFPSVEGYRQLLEFAGFTVNEIALHPRPTPLPHGLTEWLRLFARQSVLEGIADDEAEEIIREIVKICEVDCMDESGQWTLMYVRLRFSSVLQY